MEIVRCERTLQDRKAITQGIIGCPYKCYTYYLDGNNIPHYKDEFTNTASSGTNTNFMCHPGFFTMDFSSVYHSMGTGSNAVICIPSTNMLMFSSAELCYQQDDIDNIIRSNSDIYIQCLCKYYPNSNTQDYENQSSSNPGMRIFSKQTKHSTMPYCFFWPYDHYSLIRNRDIDFIYNYDNKYGAPKGHEKSYSSGSRTRFYYNYFTPDYEEFYNESTKINIKDFTFIDSPKYSDFAKNELFTYKNNTTSLQNSQFVNWSVPLLLNLSGEDEYNLKDLIDDINPGEIYTTANGANQIQIQVGRRACYPIGTGGKLILFYTDDFNTTNGENNKVPSVTIANICKKTIPYNGYNKSSIDNSNYLSFGDYSSITNNSICVFSGDTKNRIFTYHALHTWYDTNYKNCVKMSSVYAVPVETDIDIQAQYGVLNMVGDFSDWNVQDEPSAFDEYTQTNGAYLYNTVYNATPDIVSWTTPEQLETKQDYFDTRIHFSNVKTNNEDIDSWLQFAPSNYLDVDSRYGEITDLKLFKDRLVFWQENATGILAVNERVVLNDQNDTQVVLGTGGVLERYDYITTVYGQKKNQHARVVTNDSLYWWDGNNKEILVHQQKFDSTPLSTIKYIKNHVNKKPESDTPFISYDNKYKEVLFNVVNNQSIVYNEQIQAFTGIYTFNPLYDFILNGDLYLTDDSTVYKYNDQYINQTTEKQESKLFETPIHPLVRYVVNKEPVYTKAYDIQLIGGRFYGGGFDDDLHERNNDALEDINLIYKTPLKQEGRSIGTDMTNVEYDYRITVPRAGYEATEDDQIVWKVKEYGDRLRGKVMRCEINSDNSNPDFSLQYVTTKFRMSWN